MYAAHFLDGEWWVGFLYSDGRFDRIRTHGSRSAAERAVERMNSVSSWLKRETA